MPMKRGAAMTPQDELDKALEEYVDKGMGPFQKGHEDDCTCVACVQRECASGMLRDLALAVRDAAAKIMDNEPLMGDYEEFGDAIRKMDLPDLISALARKKVGG
jgi:hypothetical protein